LTHAEGVRESRVIAETLRRGLDLLGIETPSGSPPVPLNSLHPAGGKGVSPRI
jgi:hypothetical protein